MRKNYLKRMITMLLALTLCVGVLPQTGMQASAAVSWPTLTSKYCEFTALKNINVYQNSALTVRGTASPSKKYNAYIAKNDVCKIYKITSSYIYLAYPTSSGERYGYIDKRVVFSSVNSPSEVVISNAKVNTYKSASTSYKYGNVAVGDTVYKIGVSGNYVVIIYSAPSGSRGYKMGCVSKNDYEKIKSSSSASSQKTTTGYTQKKNEFIQNSKWKNGATWAASKTPTISTYGSKGCCAYAADFVKYVFNNNSPCGGYKFYNPSEIRAGDVIYVSNSSHWFVVLERNGNQLKTAEGNWGGKVVIGNYYSVSGNTLMRNGSKFRTFQCGYHFQ